MYFVGVTRYVGVHSGDTDADIIRDDDVFAGYGLRLDADFTVCERGWSAKCRSINTQKWLTHCSTSTAHSFIAPSGSASMVACLKRGRSVLFTSQICTFQPASMKCVRL